VREFVRGGQHLRVGLAELAWSGISAFRT
jgi:hypothetical protein